MNKETILYRELTAFLPYNVKVEYGGEAYDLTMVTNTRKVVILKPFMSNQIAVPIADVKPYLRPLSTMTVDEDEACRRYKLSIVESCDELLGKRIAELHNWYKSHYFDYNGLIDKSMAVAAPDGMYGEHDTTSPSSNHYEHSFMDD